MARKILFLDIDGVLNSTDYMKNRETEGILGMDPQAVALLIDIIHKTDCKIVVSSSWRIIGLGPGSLYRSCLKKCDPARTVLKATIGHTPSCSGDNKTRRGNEIQRWMDTQDFKGTFVIVDDGSDMGHLMGHLVQTTFQHGLTRELADEIIRRLNLPEKH